MHFNSQPHEEADGNSAFGKELGYCISTHSLTRRLTKFGIYCGYYWYNFNSQPHEEADGVLQDTHHSPTFISTHSLTRRLTEETTL